MAVKDVHDIPRCVFNRNQAKQDLQGRNICLTDSDNDYIPEWIELRDKIEYNTSIRGDGDEENSFIYFQ